MADTKERKGEFYLFLEIFIWGFFPVVTVLSYALVSPVVSFLWSTIFAAIFFAVILTLRKTWHEIWNLLLWKYAIGIALTIGVLFYGCYFLGLETTTPGNAAIIALFEVFTAFVFFSVLRKALPSYGHMLGSALMILGALIVLAPNFSGFHTGDALILLGTLFTPLGNHLQQKAREIASSETIMFLRCILSLPFIALFALAIGTSLTGDVRPALFFLIVNGVIMLGLSKILWIEAIHRVWVPKAIALQSLDPFVTLLLAWAILSQAPTLWQIASLVPFVLGTLLLTGQISLSRKAQ